MHLIMESVVYYKSMYALSEYKLYEMKAETSFITHLTSVICANSG